MQPATVTVNLAAELNQLVDELIESVVVSVERGRRQCGDDEIDSVVREVLDSLLDQIETRLNENRVVEDDSSLLLKGGTGLTNYSLNSLIWVRVKP